MRRAILTTAAALASVFCAASQNTFDPTSVVVMGGGISAGYADFHLVRPNQVNSWPALVAGPMGTVISLPTYRDDGQAGVLNAFQPLPGLLPQVSQGGERALPFPIFAMNLSVPFLKLADSLRLRPLLRYDGSKLSATIEHDLLDTFVVGILGGPLISLPAPVLLTQSEYARMMAPTAIFVELGSQDALDAALSGDTGRLTPVSSFTSDYSTLLQGLLPSNATLVVMTVPDPTDTAYFSTVAEAAALQGVSAADLAQRLNLQSGDLLTLAGLVESGEILRGRRKAPLSADAVLPAATAATIRSTVTQYNSAIRNAAGTSIKVFDLYTFLHNIRTAGAAVGSVRVTGAFNGGFYSTDQLFPNATGQALLANAILQFVNSSYGTKYPAVSVPGPPDPAIGPRSSENASLITFLGGRQ
ncbi:MAG: hypothetical protein JST11_27525 [Acidobacteria bacterium]|nr:hypothetical protein [Acidobacteriota bacterium]